MKIAKNISSNFFSQFLIALLSFAFIPFYLKELGAAAYGIVGLFSVAQAFFSLLDVGIGHFLTKELLSGSSSTPAIYDLTKKSVRLFISFFILLAIGLFFLADVLHFYAVSPEYFINTDYFRLLCLVMVTLLGLRSIESIYKAVLYGLNKQVDYNLVSSIFAILKVAGLLAMLPLLEEYNLVFFFGWQLLCLLILVLLLRAKVAKSMEAFGASGFNTSKLQITSPVIQFAGGLSLFSLLALTYTQLDKLVVANMSSLASFGIYSFVSVAAASISYFAVPVMQAMYPSFCAEVAAKNNQSLLKIFRQSTQLVCSLVITFSVIGVLFSREILLLWTRSNNLSGSISFVFSILLLANTCISLSLVPNYLLIAMGRVSRLKKQMFFQVISLCFLLFCFVPRMGQVGAATALLIVSAGYLLIVLPVNLKSSNLQDLRFIFYSDFLKTLLTVLIVGFGFKLISLGLSIPYSVYIPLVFVLTLLSSIYSSSCLRRGLGSRLGY